MKCPSCEREFRPDACSRPCAGCPAASGCHSARCPYCGSTIPEEPRLARWLRERLARKSAKGGAA